MPSFSVTSTTSTSAYIRIVPDSAYLHYRVFVRLYDDNTDCSWDEKYELSSTNTVEVSGLEPETEYAVNVGYNNDGGDTWTWIGASSFTTEAEVEGAPVKIFVNGEWVDAIPYVYDGGEWKKATPYIYANGWQATKS